MTNGTEVSESQTLTREGFVHRVAHGTLANVLRQILNVVGQLALVPVLLSCWGQQLYGEWQVLSAMVTYLVILDFGVQTYVVNRMSQCYARSETRNFLEVLHSALASSSVVCVAGAAVFLPVLWLIPLESWFQLKVTGQQAAMIGSILTLQTICSVPVGILGGVYRAVGEYARDITISNFHRVVTLALTGFIAIAGGGLKAVAVMQLVALVIVMFFLRIDIERRHPAIRVGFKYRDWRLAGSFVLPSFFFFVMQLSTVITIHGGTLLVGAYLGAGTVAIFATLRTLVNMVSQTTSSLAGPLWREFTVFEARGDYQVMDDLHRLTAKLMLWVCFSVAVLLHFLGRDAVMLWTGGRITYDQLLMDSLLLMQIVATWHLASSLVLGASNNHRMLAFCRLASSVAGLGIGSIFVHHVGVVGVVLGLTVADAAFCGLVVPVLACRVSKSSVKRFLREVVCRGVLFCGLLYVVAYPIAQLVSTEPAWTRLTVTTAVVLLLGPGLAWVFWFSRSEKEKLRSFVPILLPLNLLRRSAGA